MSSSRQAEIKRKTNETDISIFINIDGNGISEIDTGIPFLDHMLHQISSHGLFDLKIRAIGDTHIDDHHTNEDVGIALGKAFTKALGERKGINRFGHFFAPLDEALVQVTLDCSGRPHLSYGLKLKAPRIGNYDTELVREFFIAFVNSSGITLHINQIEGRNSHHIVEACFKAFSRSMRMATEIDLRRSGTIPSSKGMLEID
ncbi:Imidazoleglycerol-phosphate dehydratase [Prochlorococcus marinus str. MIT 9515]|uniref:Imidazoleglycerol-phosphate dehydratase n=1 Tax=Prochlorococcus marinus (strain MIT 9515) TaxID=167542 RepID=HIS7_PROM5|nr:imidazoleglycerol-phosphate dehydratase HisB [Prochlorococcus marinus]A2BUR2.1 RecName: Full=Imidazoleglycerol-phosphate dehydratase; Short=IGPD [Prochlorococcus marinus str. MIT 9515]ABM71523.1 Imidazoleglycerol-phosphate dehydratase [Prochlorococcus marinus str. MIT 9515]